MDGRVILILSLTWIQFFQCKAVSAYVPESSGLKFDVTKGPLADDEKAKVAQELHKLREHGEALKIQLRQFAKNFPGLDKMTDTLVNSVNHHAESFVNFNKERLEDPQRRNRDSRFRKSLDTVKGLEKGFLSEIQKKFGTPTNEAATLTDGNREVRRIPSRVQDTRTQP